MCGKPVTDLLASEFQLSIDGKPKTVVFSRFTGDRPAEAAARPAEVSNREAHRPTVLLLDLLNNRTLSGTEIVETAVQAVRDLDSAEDLYLYLLSARGQLYPIHAVPRGEMDVERSTEPWTRNIAPMLQSAFKTVLALRPGSENDVVERLSLTAGAMMEIVHALKPISGRKSLVWVSHGTPLCGSSRPDDDSVQLTFRLRQICEELEQAQVAVYPVMQSTRGAAAAVGTNSELDLEEIAALTGGRKYGSGYVREAVQQAIADSRSNYRIAYYAAEMKADSKYHKLRLVSTRKDVRLQAKIGFYAVPPLTDPQEWSRSQLEIACRSLFDSSMIRLRGSVARAGDSPQSLRIDLRIEPADLFLHEAGEQRSGRFSVWFSAFDAGGWNQPGSPGPIGIRLTQQQYAAALRDGIPFQQAIRVKAAATKVRAIVRDEELGTIGSVTLPIPH
jgi:VWFA-related protein